MNTGLGLNLPGASFLGGVTGKTGLVIRVIPNCASMGRSLAFGPRNSGCRVGLNVRCSF